MLPPGGGTRFYRGAELSHVQKPQTRAAGATGTHVWRCFLFLIQTFQMFKNEHVLNF